LSVEILTGATKYFVLLVHLFSGISDGYVIYELRLHIKNLF